MRRALFLCTAFGFGIIAAVACDGAREPPTPVDDDGSPPPPSNGPGGNQGGAAQGGQGGGDGGGGNGTGGGAGLTFGNCGCALETLDDLNAACGDCRDNIEQDSLNPCNEKQAACIGDGDCSNALFGLQDCQGTPTLGCAEATFAGLPTSSANLLVDYFDCICVSCAPSCDPDGQGGSGTGGGGGFGGQGGSPGNGTTCTID